MHDTDSSMWHTPSGELRGDIGYGCNEIAIITVFAKEHNLTHTYHEASPQKPYHDGIVQNRVGMKKQRNDFSIRALLRRRMCATR